MIEIRNAELQNADVVSRIVCACYDRFAKTDDWRADVVAQIKEQRGSSECIRELIRHQNVWAAHGPHGVVGMISVRENEVTKLFVDPAFRRQGIGTQLFQHAEQFIRSNGFATMVLGAATRTPITFYRKMDMTVTGTQPITFGPCVGMTSTMLEKRLNP